MKVVNLHVNLDLREYTRPYGMGWLGNYPCPYVILIADLRDFPRVF